MASLFGEEDSFGDAGGGSGVTNSDEYDVETYNEDQSDDILSVDGTSVVVGPRSVDDLGLADVNGGGGWLGIAREDSGPLSLLIGLRIAVGRITIGGGE